MKKLLVFAALLLVNIVSAQEALGLDKIHTGKRLNQIVGRSVVYEFGSNARATNSFSILELEGEFEVLGGEYVVMKKTMTKFKKYVILRLEVALRNNYKTTKYRTVVLEKVKCKKTGKIYLMTKGIIKKFAFTVDGTFNHEYAYVR